MVSISDQIKTRRIELKMSQKELANEAKISVSTLKSIELGDVSVKTDILINIANVLGTSIMIGKEEKTEIDNFQYNVNSNKNFKFIEDCGFELEVKDIIEAIHQTNNAITTLPDTVFQSVDFKTTSGIIGAIFCKAIESITEGFVNPIEKGHPDIVPKEALDYIDNENMLKNYPLGLEIKSTIGSVKTGSNLRTGDTRIDHLTGITWQAHHREVERLMGLVWDFIEVESDDYFPVITGVFYSNDLMKDDWGNVSGTTGRNTKVSQMLVSGKEKMGSGWIAILDNKKYLIKYKHILKIGNK